MMEWSLLQFPKMSIERKGRKEKKVTCYNCNEKRHFSNKYE